MNTPKLGERQIEYENRYQQTYRIDADFGEFTKQYFITDYGPKAGIIVDRQDSILLVRQYRFLINGESLEIPGGSVDSGETPAEAAIRETMEESGVKCLDPRPLAFYHVGMDSVDSPAHIFWTDQVDEENSANSMQNKETSGRIWVPLNQCIEMISLGKIVDVFTVVGLLAYLSRKGNL